MTDIIFDPQSYLSSQKLYDPKTMINYYNIFDDGEQIVEAYKTMFIEASERLKHIGAIPENVNITFTNNIAELIAFAELCENNPDLFEKVQQTFRAIDHSIIFHIIDLHKRQAVIFYDDTRYGIPQNIAKWPQDIRIN